MTFQLPNLPDTSFIDQAEPDAVDFTILGERGTGVISGCAVTAQGSPALFVDVALGTAVIAGAPVSITAGSLAIISGEAQPRFDLIVLNNAGVKSVIKGTASTNPRFPTMDPTVYCTLAAVYVPQSAGTIIASYIVDKRATVAATFTRVYGDDTTESIKIQNNTSKTFKVMSSGEHRWMSSILKRTADSAMEWATSLVIKAADNALAVLIAKARSGTTAEVAAQHLLEFQTNGGTITGFINGAGQAFFDNIKSGVAAPEGAVLGNKGDIFINRAFVSANAALYIKTTDGTNTGWQAMAMYDPSTQALTTGVVVSWIGNPASPPGGFAVLNGQSLSATAPANVPLYNMIGNTYGGVPGVNFLVPDWTNVSPMGVGSTVTLGVKAGAISSVITVNHMPSHSHPVLDNGHQHPWLGQEYIYSPPSMPTWGRIYPAWLPPVDNDPTTPYVNIVSVYADRVAKTGITLGNTGNGSAFPTLSPVVGTHFIVRL